MPVPHIPALRAGRPYLSPERVEVRDVRTGQSLAVVSQVNAGLIRRDLPKLDQAAASLRALSAKDILERLAEAADHFERAPLPLGDAHQSSDDFIAMLSATSGLPEALVRGRIARIAEACRQMPEILAGLMRGADIAILDRGWAPWNGSAIAFAPLTNALGVLMPSNSPGVNQQWLPALALKTPVVIKPGRDEPWTPYRLIQACIAAGFPAEAFSYYPTDHAGAAEILHGCGRAMLFGDAQTTGRYRNLSSVQIHGPGWSKVVIGDDFADRWRDYLDVCASSVLDNSGRSCINASAIVVSRHADAIADALAARLAAVEPRNLSDEDAALAAFTNPAVAEGINAAIDRDLRIQGAVDVTARHRAGGRIVRHDGATFLLPTVIRCDSFVHPLATREYLFPYVAVVEVPQADIPRRIGSSLVVSVISNDETLIRGLLAAPSVGHLHIGPIPTWQIRWDQPHEGNLFEFLYRQRAFQLAGQPVHTP
jgi:acyl-CoA reductase-like NAD-dependent aldehyde dehydrogenase